MSLDSDSSCGIWLLEVSFVEKLVSSRIYYEAVTAPWHGAYSAFTQKEGRDSIFYDGY